jgi:hypothetical protein
MQYLFVDETGDPSNKVDLGSSQYFGMALLQVGSDYYSAVRKVISYYRWLSGMFAELKKLPQKTIVGLNVLRGIMPLAEEGLVSASGLYIDKTKYGGRYLTWSDVTAQEDEWPYYLRNYLLRHLLEFHFSPEGISIDTFDLVLDRIMLTEPQRVNTLNYLNSKSPIPLSEPFKIPSISYLTIADSEYIGSLQLVHLLAELVKEYAKNTISEEQMKLSKFLRVTEFLGHKKAD